MTPPFRKSLIALSFFGAVTAAMAQEPGQAGITDRHVIDAQEWSQLDTSYAEGKQDPPGVLNQKNLKSLKQLAVQLSSDRKWLTREVLKSLNTMSVHLDEVFAEAPEFIEIEGKLYRVLLEKVGPGWTGFNPRSSKYLVFLNHEAYDGLGENYALGFEGGKERVISWEEAERVAAIGLTLQEISSGERPKDRRGVVGLEAPIRLGKVHSTFRSPQDRDLRNLLKSRQAALTSCAPVEAPTACSNGVPVCTSGTAAPYFVLSSIKIKTDHEGAFKGNPEIELFPLRINPTSPVGGSSDVRTQWIFSGRTVTDLAGRATYLPDVQNKNQWYSVYGGLAVFPSRLSNSYVATVVENDDIAGKLEIDRNKNNPIKRPREAYIQIWPFDYLDFLKDLANFIYTLGFLSDSDDLFVESLEVTNDLFCTEGLGQPFPYNFLMSASEWDMQGYFACVDPACVPPPPDDDGGGGGGCGPYPCP